MRYTLPELLSGMLASIETDGFSDEPARLAAMFEDLAGRFALFAPFGSAINADAVSQALGQLEQQGILQRDEGRYLLPDIGRAKCVRSKRTLFNGRDIAEIEQAASVFNEL